MEKDSLSNLCYKDFDEIGSDYRRNRLRTFEIETEIVFAGTRLCLRIQPTFFQM